MAYVISHPDMGIYLGNCFGLGFWSKLDPVGQESAITFPSQDAADSHMATWENEVPAGVTLVEVSEDSEGYASVQACIEAGLEGWDPSIRAQGELA